MTVMRDWERRPDVVRLKTSEGDCVWCWARLKRRATHRVWSKEWGMYMNCCARHALWIARANEGVR
jgi:hypothetical protein